MKPTNCIIALGFNNYCAVPCAEKEERILNPAGKELPEVD